MIVSKSYTVVLRIAKIAGVSPYTLLPPLEEDDKIFTHPIEVESNNQPPHIHYRAFPYKSEDCIRVGSEWLQNNLTDEEMAQWVALRLLGKLDKTPPYMVRGGYMDGGSPILSNYSSGATIPLKRDAGGILGVCNA